MLNDTHKLHALLFLGWPEADWVGQVVEDDGAVSILWRFRFHDPTPRQNDVWDGADVKNWYRSDRPGLTVTEALTGAVALQARLAWSHGRCAENPDGFGGLPDVIDGVWDLDGDQGALMEQLKAKPWAHAKEFDSEEEAERFLASKRPS